MVRRGTFTRRSNATRVYLWSLQLVGFPQWRHERRSAFGARNGDVVSYRSFDDKQDGAHYRQCHEAINSEKGQPFDPTLEQKKVFEEAVLAGAAMSKANTFDKRIGAPIWPGSQWKHAMHLEPSQRVENYG